MWSDSPFWCFFFRPFSIIPSLFLSLSSHTSALSLTSPSSTFFAGFKCDLSLSPSLFLPSLSVFLFLSFFPAHLQPISVLFSSSLSFCPSTVFLSLCVCQLVMTNVHLKTLHGFLINYLMNMAPNGSVWATKELPNGCFCTDKNWALLMTPIANTHTHKIYNVVCILCCSNYSIIMGPIT